ncbi:hypothetical protein [Clostridium ganghwense]|uniref:HTH cro/C1-type domain-containing protein n=1 Tax=Clostridium ganghwense TaxID=312089 RepID=A0ABT4CWG7_9CLOT|nr:hypothetical protein [Clostridium ganghwense]MCY6372763.1 hypothetical protein [Clostridium ganghwense]
MGRNLLKVVNFASEEPNQPTGFELEIIEKNSIEIDSDFINNFKNLTIEQLLKENVELELQGGDIQKLNMRIKGEDEVQTFDYKKSNFKENVALGKYKNFNTLSAEERKEMIKGEVKERLTQKVIARNTGTTQSTISRNA